MKRGLGILVLLLCFVAVWAQVPTSPSSSISFTNKYCSQITINWTSGDGANRIVVAHKGSAVSATPSDDVYYIARDSFGVGDMLSDGSYVVYNNFGNSAIIENLEPNTTYHFAIFEHNGSGSTYSYLTSSYPQASTTTEYITSDFTIDDTYQCDSGNVFNFTAAASQSASSTLSYLWRFGDGSTSTAQDPSHSYATGGFYDVTLEVSSFRCYHDTMHTDTVVFTPIVSFILDPDTMNNSQIQCFSSADGSTNRFAFKLSFDNGGLSGTNSPYSYNYGDGTPTDYSGGGRKQYMLPGTFNVNLVMYSFIGSQYQNQTSEHCIDSFVLPVQVKPIPVDPDDVLISDTSMCLKGNLFYMDHINPDAGLTNTWYFGDGSTDVGSSVTHSYSSAGIYPIRLEVVDAAGCYGEYHDTIEVVAQPVFNYSGLDSTYCLGDNDVDLAANLITDGVFFGDQVDAANSRFSPNTLGYNYVSYRVTVGDCMDTFTRRTEVLPIPSFSLGPDSVICLGDDVVLSVSPGNGLLTWSSPSADTFISVSTDGIYWAEVTERGCTFRDSFQLTTITEPSFDLGMDTTMCGDGYRDVDVSAPLATYTWTDGFVGPTRRLSTTGLYEVTVSNKCGTSTDQVDIEVLAFACEIFVPNAFTPNNDAINNIFRPVGTVEFIEMAVYNKWGEKLYEGFGQDMGWDGNSNGVLCQQDDYYFVIRYYLPTDGVVVPKTISGVFYLMY